MLFFNQLKAYFKYYFNANVTGLLQFLISEKSKEVGVIHYYLCLKFLLV